MTENLQKEIRFIRETYGVSLAQFGALLGAPATSVKRWQEGVRPQERFAYQIILVIGLIQDPDEIFYDLGRQGIQLKKEYWNAFASLVTGAKKSIEVAEKKGFPRPEVNTALVEGVKGMLSLIASAFAAETPLGCRIFPELATRIANLLK